MANTRKTESDKDEKNAAAENAAEAAKAEKGIESSKAQQLDKRSDGDKVEDSGARRRSDGGTGLQSLTVDREITVTPVGEKIGDEEGDPRRFTPVAGKEVVDHAESGEPVIVGGVPTMTSGVPADAAGMNDPTIGVAATTDAALAYHESTRDEWYEIDEADSDGSPVDRLRAGQPQNPQMESETQESATNTKAAKAARKGDDGDGGN